MKSPKYQVFLSSTYSDLILERESIIKAILEMYHIPIGMEMFSAEDEDQWEIIRRTIEVSDYYILVLGLRYGSKTSDGISFTQKEYEYALAKKIPILAFVMNEMVSLPRDKRDDDLAEINKFREMVLKNSKMAQFWETKDQLIKNVSISLMKEIMQKPGVGWVRGDKANSEEALSQELTSLSKENRELREKIRELESKISLKSPKIKLDMNTPVIDDKYDSCKKLVLPKKLDINDIETHLRKYVSEEELGEYNSSIPSQSEIDAYNNECERIYKVKNYSTSMVINVGNAGTVKANNLYIDIEFPEELLVYEKATKFDEPKSPLPHSPIRRAQLKYKQELQELQDNNSLLTMFRDPLQLTKFREPLIHIDSIAQPKWDIPNIRPINQRWWTKLDGRILTIKVDSLLHTRCINFDDEYLIVPLKAGKHNIEIRVICEELENQETQVLEMDIQGQL